MGRHGRERAPKDAQPPAGRATVSSTNSLDVGPVAPASAVAWIEWADETFRALREEPPSCAALSADAMDGIEAYFDQWMARGRTRDEAFRWRAEISPDELEYLLHGLFSLDVGLSADAQGRQRQPEGEEARPFHLVLVRALLHALESESPGRAAFVDQLCSAWPSAAKAR